MARLLPIPASNAHASEIRSGVPKQPDQLQKRSERPGPLHTKKVRSVCSVCNNGWMSEIESAAKPSLLRALASDTFTFSPEETRCLATWAVLKAIVAEHASEDPLTPLEDRVALKTDRMIPPYFQVFLAKHKSSTLTAYKRHSATLSLTIKGPQPPLPKGITRNTQATTLLVGPLCFYITAVRVSNLNPLILAPKRPMHQIHPSTKSDLDLASTTALNDIDIYLISEAVERIVQDPKVRYAGEHLPK